MGPYCKYCDRRCFVERLLPFTTGTLLMATCPQGMAHDRAVTGHDHETAVNPHDVWGDCVMDAEVIYEPLEQARGIAVHLEQENAVLRAGMRRAAAFVRTLECESGCGETPCGRCVALADLVPPESPERADRTADLVHEYGEVPF